MRPAGHCRRGAAHHVAHAPAAPNLAWGIRRPAPTPRREDNFRLNAAMTKARAINMPKDKMEAAIKRGAGFIALSDRLANEERVPIPSLLVAGAVHQELVRDRLRMSVPLRFSFSLRGQAIC